MQTNYDKLCEAAGIQQQYNCRPHIDLCCKLGLCSPACAEYPAFTAEKQIELIKILAKDNRLNIAQLDLTGDMRYMVSLGFKMEINFGGESIEEALACLALQLLEAGELDKEEVRRVLE